MPYMQEEETNFLYSFPSSLYPNINSFLCKLFIKKVFDVSIVLDHGSCFFSLNVSALYSIKYSLRLELDLKNER